MRKGGLLTDGGEVGHHDPADRVGEGEVDILEDEINGVLLELAYSDDGRSVLSHYGWRRERGV